LFRRSEAIFAAAIVVRRGEAKMADIESQAEWVAPLSIPTLAFATSPPPLMYNLNPNEPPGFAAKQVIYRKIVSMPPISCRYEFIDEPTPITAGFEGIEAFVARAAGGGYQAATLMPEEDNPLGILVKKDSFIVLHLSDSTPSWYFTSANEAVTLGPLIDTGNPSLVYGDLKYVRPNGQIFDHPVGGCRLVYFKARYREGSDEEPYIQKFWIGVDDQSPPRASWIDPDVRHPGNGTS
jgi:hypothetical protein